MAEVEKEWGENFLVQKRIEQHPVTAKPHPASVNTLRMLTLRWEGEIRNLLSYIRIGTGGRPPHSSCHMALWPAAQRLRFIIWGSSVPVNTAGIQSQISTQE